MTKVFVCAALLAFVAAAPASASILNVGVNISSNGAQTVMPFYSQSSTGLQLGGSADWVLFTLPGEMVTIVLNTAAVFGPGPLIAAELFIDAYDVDCCNTSEVYVQGVLVGSLANTPAGSLIPVAAGPVGTHVANPGDVDNSFFNLAPFLADLISDSTFTIQIRNTTPGFIFRGDSIRVDGINIQASTADPQPVIFNNPEPVTLAIWSGLAGIGGAVAWRRQRRAA
jgi:hypothetical protein